MCECASGTNLHYVVQIKTPSYSNTKISIDRLGEISFLYSRRSLIIISLGKRKIKTFSWVEVRVWLRVIFESERNFLIQIGWEKCSFQVKWFQGEVINSVHIYMTNNSAGIKEKNIRRLLLVWTELRWPNVHWSFESLYESFLLCFASIY